MDVISQPYYNGLWLKKIQDGRLSDFHHPLLHGKSCTKKEGEDFCMYTGTRQGGLHMNMLVVNFVLVNNIPTNSILKVTSFRMSSLGVEV